MFSFQRLWGRETIAQRLELVGHHYQRSLAFISGGKAAVTIVTAEAYKPVRQVVQVFTLKVSVDDCIRNWFPSAHCCVSSRRTTASSQRTTCSTNSQRICVCLVGTSNSQGDGIRNGR